ncbi:MAG: RDD family protein [Marinilabiliaceae bacterium]|nr:RDD family protein [Marinilabiliaceae bacterium]
MNQTIHIINKLSNTIKKWLLKNIPVSIKENFHNQTFSSEGIERMIALMLDSISVFILSLFPLWGCFFGIAYFLLKDALPFLNGQSIGKYFMGLKVVNKESLTPITKDYKKSIIRGVVLLIPILNIIDIYRYLTIGERLADKWAETVVIKDRYFI